MVCDQGLEPGRVDERQPFEVDDDPLGAGVLGLVERELKLRDRGGVELAGEHQGHTWALDDRFELELKRSRAGGWILQ